MPIGWQLILRRVDDAVLAPGVAARRAFAAAVGRVARGFPLLVFAAAGGHAHLVLRGERARAGELARRLQVSLGRVLGHAGALEPARLRPVHDQRHLRNLVRYILDQERHHGLEPDPLHEASALPDLLGLRVTGAWLRPLLALHLPDLGRPELVGLLGLDPHLPVPLDPAHLPPAAAAAVGRPALAGREPLRVLARAAALQLAEAGAPGSGAAAALGLPRRTAARLQRRPVPPALSAAILGQWRLRSATAAPPASAPAAPHSAPLVPLPASPQSAGSAPSAVRTVQ